MVIIIIMKGIKVHLYIYIISNTVNIWSSRFLLVMKYQILIIKITIKHLTMSMILIMFQQNLKFINQKSLKSDIKAFSQKNVFK